MHLPWPEMNGGGGSQYSITVIAHIISPHLIGGTYFLLPLLFPTNNNLPLDTSLLAFSRELD